MLKYLFVYIQYCCLGITLRLQKVVRVMEKLLDDEVYHDHSNITAVPNGRSGWSWHQDYSYLYQND